MARVTPDCPAAESTGGGRAQNPAGATTGISPVSRSAAGTSAPAQPSRAPRAGADPKTSVAALDLALGAAADQMSPQPGGRAGAAGIPGPETGVVPDRVAAPVRVRAENPAGAGRRRAAGAVPAGINPIAAAMSEDRGPDSLEANLRRLMKDLGLWGYHPRRSEKSEKGWPDWVIIGTRIIHRELKTERGKVTPEQEAVGQRITAAGGDWDVWRPRDLMSGRIADELRAITAGPLGLGGAA